jgi:outer membrane protein assembly factor BamB
MARAQVAPVPPEIPEGEDPLEPVETAPKLVVPDGILPVGEIGRIEHGPSDRTRLLLQERRLVLVTRGGSVEARDTSSGEFSWKLGLPGEVLFPPVALRSEPFEILLSSPSGKLLIVDGESGNIRREIALGFELALAPHPSADRIFLGTPSGAIVSMDLATGIERFRTETGEPPSAVAISGRLLVVSGAERTLTALSVDTGELRWSFHARAGFFAPAVFRAEGDRLYVGDDAGEFYCLSSDKGNVQYRWSTGAAIRHAALVVGKRVYVTSFGNVLYAFDAGGGAERWRANLPGRPASGAVLVGKALVVATLDGTLVEVNPERGQLGKSYSAPGELSGPPSFWVAAEEPLLPEEAAPEPTPLSQDDPLAPAEAPAQGPPLWYERHRIAIALRSGEVLLLGHQAPALEAPELPAVELPLADPTRKPPPSPGESPF